MENSDLTDIDFMINKDEGIQYDTKLHNKLRKICVKSIKTIEKCKKVVYYETIKERGDRKRNY